MPATPSRQSGPPTRAMAKGRAIDPLRVLRQHWKGIVLWGVVGGVLGIGAHLLLSRVYPLYSAEVLFEVRPGLGEADEIGTVDTFNENMVERVQATQSYMILSEGVLSLALEDSEIDNTTWIQQFKDPDGTVILNDALDELTKGFHRLKPVIKRGTNLYGVRWSTHVPEDILHVLTSVQKQYLLRIAKLDNEGFDKNRVLFEEEGRRIKMALLDLNDELKGFIQAKGITTLDDTRWSATMFEIQKLTEGLTQTRATLTMTQQQYLQVAAKLDGTMESSMEDRLIAERDPIIMRQEQTLELLEANLRALRERLEPSHPQIIDTEISVRATKDQIESKIIRRNLNAQLGDLVTSRDQLSVSHEQFEEQIEAKDAELRDLAANQSTYEHMESLRNQLELQRDENQRLTSSLRMMQLRQDASRVRLAQPVVQPREKSFPKLEVMMPAGTFFGIVAFVGFIFFRETTDQKIRSASDVLIIPGAKVAGVLPDVHEDPSGLETAELAVIHSSDGVFAESCRQAWAGVNRTLQQSAHQTVLVLAVAPEAGSTTIIGNFAASAHTSGVNAVVVDCNFRRPNLASMFDLDDASLGVADLLTGTVDFEGVVQQTDTGVDVISAGTPANRLFQRLGSERMNSLLAQLRAKYELVLIDAPPSIVAGDAVLLANLVDAIILVVHSDRDDRGMVARVLRELGECRGDIIGVVVNVAMGTVGGYFRKNYLAMVSYSDQEEDEEDE